jgi:hypothetical protein
MARPPPAVGLTINTAWRIFEGTSSTPFHSKSTD